MTPLFTEPALEHAKVYLGPSHTCKNKTIFYKEAIVKIIDRVLVLIDFQLKIQ